MRTVLYDTEITNCIPVPGEPIREDLNYCGGWDDFLGMGISILCAYSLANDEMYTFTLADLPHWGKLAATHERIVSFNGRSFDDRLVAAHGVYVRTNYDLLCEARVASGQPAEYTPGKTRAGYHLDALAQSTLHRGKTGSGALAPMLWQEGKKKEVVAYCQEDVRILRDLYLQRDRIIDPIDGRTLVCRP